MALTTCLLWCTWCTRVGAGFDSKAAGLLLPSAVCCQAQTNVEVHTIQCNICIYSYFETQSRIRAFKLEVSGRQELTRNSLTYSRGFKRDNTTHQPPLVAWQPARTRLWSSTASAAHARIRALPQQAMKLEPALSSTAAHPHCNNDSNTALLKKLKVGDGGPPRAAAPAAQPPAGARPDAGPQHAGEGADAAGAAADTVMAEAGDAALTPEAAAAAALGAAKAEETIEGAHAAALDSLIASGGDAALLGAAKEVAAAQAVLNHAGLVKQYLRRPEADKVLRAGPALRRGGGGAVEERYTVWRASAGHPSQAGEVITAYAATKDKAAKLVCALVLEAALGAGAVARLRCPDPRRRNVRNESALAIALAAANPGGQRRVPQKSRSERARARGGANAAGLVLVWARHGPACAHAYTCTRSI